ncbi:MAG TPA: antibiotic biosynthesis monooxygenase [Streptosporangiaceae bacterium]|jgi:quinol monooxygenase YgiN|nr:antibiotic biosynthesis monooxygenase [Streptosporangiaceae bacterium]
MSFHFVVAIVGALVAAAGTGVLASRSARAPNAALIAWVVAVFGLTVSLGAQALGYNIGFGPIAFRAMEIGGQLLAPIALALGLAEVVGRSVTARFAARLILSALAVVALVVFATDPLSAAQFSKAWPPTTVYYQIVPNKLIEFVLAPAMVIVVLVAITVVVVRTIRREPGWQDALPAVGAASSGAILLAVPGIAALLSLSVPLASLFAPLCLLAAGATWLAGTRLDRLQLGTLRQAPSVGDDTGYGWDRPQSWGGRADETGDFDQVADDDEFGIYRGNGARRPPDDTGYPAYGEQDSEAFPRPPFDQQEQDEGHYAETGYPSDPDYPSEVADYSGEPGFGSGRGYPEAVPPPVPLPAMPPPMDPAAHGSKEDLFGQIAIYTLLEDRVEDFDRLTKNVVKQVRSHEPGTLVYIVHAVPSAPMQRILYEVYSDRAAYETHRRQPYVVAFESDRRPFVLATNIIELGLQQAKVSPLPSVADLLTDTGFDLLNDTGFGQPGYGPRSPSGHGGGPLG